MPSVHINNITEQMETSREASSELLLLISSCKNAGCNWGGELHVSSDDLGDMSGPHSVSFGSGSERVYEMYVVPRLYFEPLPTCHFQLWHEFIKEHQLAWQISRCVSTFPIKR